VKGYGRKVARVGFHSLRHAHITALLEGGVPMDMVRQQAGHSSIGMPGHYYHASENALKAASAALPSIGKA
jgi:integrase